MSDKLNRTQDDFQRMLEELLACSSGLRRDEIWMIEVMFRIGQGRDFTPTEIGVIDDIWNRVFEGKIVIGPTRKVKV